MDWCLLAVKTADLNCRNELMLMERGECRNVWNSKLCHLDMLLRVEVMTGLLPLTSLGQSLAFVDLFTLFLGCLWCWLCQYITVT